MTELERTKRALAGARHALGLIERNPKVLERGDYLAQVQKDIDTILNPPEFEEVEVVRWMCDSCEEVYDMDPVAHGWAKCGAELNKHGGDCANNSYVKLTGTIMRPVKRKVVRDIILEGHMDKDGDFIDVHGCDRGVFKDNVPPQTKGTLIFRYTE